MSRASVPGVTVIRPLRGLDINLYNALDSTMKLRYPRFEVLFALQHDDDEALSVVRAIMEAQPNIDARVLISKRETLLLSQSI